MDIISMDTAIKAVKGLIKLIMGDVDLIPIFNKPGKR